MNRSKRIAFLTALCAVLALSLMVSFTQAESRKLCNPDIACLDIFDPVICDNGVVYSNACYAERACATGCVPFAIDR